MGCLSAATFILCSLPDNSPSTPLPRHHAPGVRRKSPKMKRQPSVAEVERAIGAGVHRDYNSRLVLSLFLSEFVLEDKPLVC